MSYSSVLYREIMPYCLRVFESDYGEIQIVVLNRNYRPVGCLDRAWQDHRECPRVYPFRLSKADIEKGLGSVFDESGYIYLYHDGTAPDPDYPENLAEYFKKVTFLMGIDHGISPYDGKPHAF